MKPKRAEPIGTMVDVVVRAGRSSPGRVFKPEQWSELRRILKPGQRSVIGALATAVMRYRERVAEDEHLARLEPSAHPHPLALPRSRESPETAMKRVLRTGRKLQTAVSECRIVMAEVRCAIDRGDVPFVLESSDAVGASAELVGWAEGFGKELDRAVEVAAEWVVKARPLATARGGGKVPLARRHLLWDVSQTLRRFGYRLTTNPTGLFEETLAVVYAAADLNLYPHRDVIWVVNGRRPVRHRRR